MKDNIISLPEFENRSFVFRDRYHAGEILVAVPTARSRAAEAAAEKADRLFCPNIRSGLTFAVAEAYENWYDISEQELLGML